MPHFQIKHWWTGRILFEGQFDTMRLCVQAAHGGDAVLRGAVLRRAVLRDAELSGAVLSDAVLSGADLRGAVLRRAVLRDAVLSGAVLSDAVLSGADLSGAVLSGAVLSGAVLSGADLSGADLSGAVLQGGCRATGAPLRRATRRDGYEFFLWPTDHGWRVGAGCRWFSFEEAWAHWSGPRPGGDPDGLNTESIDILTMFSLAMDRVEDAQ
jgi:hypothetical protein